MLKLYYGDAVKPAPSHSVRLEGKVYVSTVNGQLRYVLYAPTDTILYDIRDTFRELWEGPDCNTLFNRLDLCIRARTIKRPELKHIYLYGDMLVLRADFGRFENKDVVQVDVFDTLKALGQHLGAFTGLEKPGVRVVPVTVPVPALELQTLLDKELDRWDTETILTMDEEDIELHRLFLEALNKLAQIVAAREKKAQEKASEVLKCWKGEK